ncbi:polysaccharide deacetylase family protein [Streptomyces longispororuber]|uniref:polysaccharide deacetylase family protein n=1 Tax=Streptomyces longispororuber TaxID=68230 RepID=UPI00210BF354|nr:polysaccharide deacetylase family protein [Streptomyces longispororuber]MCQ4210080.1 polysaccharide deacetylase family protein [Streptomyces longispororuber]
MKNKYRRHPVIVKVLGSVGGFCPRSPLNGAGDQGRIFPTPLRPARRRRTHRRPRHRLRRGRAAPDHGRAHGPRTADSVALTFHGQGDPAIAHALLKEAERAHAHITVLAVGTWLDEHPDIARRILDGGHDLGNHTLHHRDINAMSESDAYAEITGCADRIRRLTGSIGTWFRPSRTPTATPLVTRLARRAGYPHVLSYDVDSLDFTSPGADTVVDNVTSALRPGSVVSLHFGYTDTVAALPPLLDHLDRRGLSAVTCTELLT